VGDVGQQRPKGHDELRAEHLGQLGDHPAERAPLHGGLVPDQQDEVARGARHPGLVQLNFGPDNPPRMPVDQLDLRTRALEVVELLGIDRREPARAQGAGHERDRT
jgi:hypothetical protein